MMPLDLLDTFDSTPAKIAFVATYEFDPIFFERRVLHKKGFAGAERILLLMDAGRYRELLRDPLPMSGFNRRYLVVPVDRNPYVFHPKLYLLLGERRVTGVIGSSNCTNAGIAFNVELCSTFSAETSEGASNPALFTLRQIYAALRSFASDITAFDATMQKEFFARAERLHPWLAAGVDLKDRLPVDLIHSHRGALWPEIKRRLKDEAVRKIAVFAPFYDKDLSFIKLVKASWPNSTLSVYAQPKYATLEGKKLATVLRKKDRLFAVTPPAGRRLHAKVFAFETSRGTCWLAGSPNATLAAMQKGNTEVALWFSTKESIDVLVSDESLTVEAIDPRQFEAGPGSEPSNRDEPGASLALGSAILQADGTLDLTFTAAAGIQDVTARITNVNESHPFLSLRVSRGEIGQARVEISKEQLAQISIAAICELKARHAGKDVLSNRVAIVQLQELLRERTSGAGSNDRIRKITETGEELVAHIDSLGTIREAIEFLNHCSIRFEDGETSRRGIGRDFWRPRDPFVGDIPSQWLSEAITNSVEGLHESVWGFVERHQHDKLEKHVRRGNLNGLPNFIDIFRALNRILVAYNRRTFEGMPVIPFQFVTTGIRTNLDLLMGVVDTDGDYVSGYIDSINANFQGDRKLVRERLLEERVPQVVRAAVDAMIEVRRAGMKRPGPDLWSINLLKRTTDWISARGLPQPTAAEVQLASTEYVPASIAA